MAPDRRGSDRGFAWVEAACDAGGITRRARLHDISKSGCRAEVAKLRAAPGDRVVLKLTELLVLPATVVWMDHGQVGLAFANPMLGALLGQFMLRHGKRERLQ